MRQLLSFLLRVEAKLILRKYRPILVAVTGSVGKTSTKEAIYQVVTKSRRAYRSFGNYNTDIGVPLSIAATPSQEVKGFWSYCQALLRGKMRIFFRDHNYPEILILEYAADRPGDIRYLVKHFPPRIAVVTAIGEIPVHLEYYKNRAQLVAEKSQILKKLGPGDVAILNMDDPEVAEMTKKTSAKIVKYGLSDKADIRASAIALVSGSRNRELGLQFKLEAQGKVVPVMVPRLVATHFVYSLLAAVVVGLEMRVGLLDIVKTLATYETPPGRMKLLPGIKNTILIDDTYNSSPLATLSALGALKALPGARKIAVLGDMLELGAKTEVAHREVGLEAAKTNLDYLVTVGPRAKFIADEARQYGMSETKVLSFDSSDEARLPVQDLVKENDLVLVKGSRGMHMEKIVREIMAQPERAEELLVH